MGSPRDAFLTKKNPQEEHAMTVRIGLVGSGFVSNFYMLGLRDVPGWEIPVVASTNAANASRFAKQWNIPEATTDIDAVVARDGLDLIILGVPNHAHKDLAIRCAEAGKHVVCTKPLARNRHEAKTMLDAVRKAGVIHGYAETEVFSPSVMRIGSGERTYPAAGRFSTWDVTPSKPLATSSARTTPSWK
jgi:predicted dehydrogenase